MPGNNRRNAGRKPSGSVTGGGVAPGPAPHASIAGDPVTINFLNKPAPVDLICEARILKLGKLLATGDAMIWSEGQDAPVAHATMTYAIPPKR